MNRLTVFPAVLALSLAVVLGACGDGDGDTSPPSGDAPTPILNVDDSGNTEINPDALDSELDNLDTAAISSEELAGLLQMREEEKLAHDVYRALYDIHGSQIFDNISQSEQTHTAAVKMLLDRYGIADPVGQNGPGKFTDPNVQALYDALVVSGTPSLIDALYVGAQIEELDIRDIEALKERVIDNADIVLVYDNLLTGSRNHLRAFNKQIIANGGEYEAEYITQDAYDAIADSAVERGR